MPKNKPPGARPAPPAEDTADGLIPQAGPDFVPAFMLATLRRDGQGWLGAARLARLAASMSEDPADTLGRLDRAPRPPASLGDAVQWLGRRIPLLHDGRVAWIELFWRPDPKGWRRNLGSFALRVALPDRGRIEMRGRLEETRLDAVLHVERLSRGASVATSEAFGDILTCLGLQGGLSVRTTEELGRT